ncbi:MAG: hypothetical protein HF312_21700, partial [Ignavibacteria bacterium]|nr:hypothetical protein [Ignavibacteria bacterium]
MIKVTSKEQAWEEANKLFPTDYAKDEQSSKNAGYPVYRSTAADHYYDYICDLGSRLEVNLSTGETVNIWIEDSQEVKDLRAEVESLKKQLCSLKTALEDELEWKAYESVHNVRQADYVRLAKS